MDAVIVTPKTTIELVKDGEPDAFYFRTLEGQGILLNEQQLEGVRNITQLLIMAGAGSGKSLCIIAKVGYLISVKKVYSSNILALTFTKKAAEELRSRLKDILGDTDIKACTIHSLCYRILTASGYRKYKLLTNEKQKIGIIKSILKENGEWSNISPGIVLAAYSYYKSIMREPEVDSDKSLIAIFRKYDAYKSDKLLLDFDDLLTETLGLLQSNPILTQLLHRQYKHILVDESQDLNQVQYQIIKLLAKESPLCIVGDSRQTIYSFRGSDKHIIQDFIDDSTGTQVVHLNINYRSTASILGLANNIIKNYHGGNFEDLLAVKPGLLKPMIIQPDDTLKEATFIADYIQELVKCGDRNYKDFGILYRTGRSASTIHDELVLRDIPFIIFGNLDLLYEDVNVRFLLDHLRLSQNPDNLEALAGILPSLNINQKAIFYLSHNKGNSKLLSLFMLPFVNDDQMELIEKRIVLIEELAGHSPSQAIKLLIEDDEIGRYIGISDTENPVHMEFVEDAIKEVEVSASRFQTSLQFLNFVDEIITKNKHVKQDAGSNAVILSTIHSVKGLQFPSVFVTGVTEGLIPHKYAIDGKDKSMTNFMEVSANDIEEECRLLYVAVTRAEEQLIISCPKMVNGYPVEMSRFIQPLLKKNK